MTLYTNIVRFQLEGQCLSYNCETDKALTKEDIGEIQNYIESLDNNYIYQHPRIYCTKELTFNKLPIYLSRGESLYLNIGLIDKIPKINILQQLGRKILRSLRFLNAEKINSCFNPFEQKNDIIPGLSLQITMDQWGIGMAILPVNLHLEPLTQISSAKLFLDYSRGRFFCRDDVVKVDKNSSTISFRDGQTVQISTLKKIRIKNISGYFLASKARNYYQRIIQSSKQLIEQWNIKFQGRFFSVKSHMINPGSITVQNSKQKHLHDIIFPIVRNAYNHYYRTFFKDIIFEEKLETSFGVLIPEILTKHGKHITKQLQILSQQMNTKTKFQPFYFSGFTNIEQLHKIANSLSTNLKNIIMILPSQLQKSEENILIEFKQVLINKQLMFHCIQFKEQQQRDELDIIALRHLAVIYSKLRLNPWKLKNIPFGMKPTVVCSINIEQMTQGNYSIVIVSSMNSLFSKFTSMRSISKPQHINDNIFMLLRRSLDQFCQTHKLYPNRFFVYRSGIVDNCIQQFNDMKNRLQKYFLSINNPKPMTVTYVKTSKSHPFRTYIQTDENFISFQTVKRSQLLSAFQIANKVYIQMELNQAPLQLEVIEPESQDPNFVNNVLQLTVRLAYGTPGNLFEKGMGFLDYGAKFNEYRNYDIRPWQQMQMVGFLMFL